MATVFVTSEVEDYDNWRKVFDDSGDIRDKYRVAAQRVYRESDNSNMITVIIDGEMDDLQTFAKSTDLYEAMTQAGVVGLPKMGYFVDVT
ncbi:MAG: cyclase [Actinomycetia bacterium]|nr:cyclase [Actinomycetes bacterium]